jgi:hypothetical protein
MSLITVSSILNSTAVSLASAAWVERNQCLIERPYFDIPEYSFEDLAPKPSFFERVKKIVKKILIACHVSDGAGDIIACNTMRDHLSQQLPSHQVTVAMHQHAKSKALKIYPSVPMTFFKDYYQFLKKHTFHLIIDYPLSVDPNGGVIDHDSKVKHIRAYFSDQTPRLVLNEYGSPSDTEVLQKHFDERKPNSFSYSLGLGQDNLGLLFPRKVKPLQPLERLGPFRFKALKSLPVSLQEVIGRHFELHVSYSHFSLFQQAFLEATLHAAESHPCIVFIGAQLPDEMVLFNGVKNVAYYLYQGVTTPIDSITYPSGTFNVTIIYAPSVTQDEFIALFRAAKTVGGTGDQSMGLSLRLKKPMLYHFLPHKTAFVTDLVQLTKKIDPKLGKLREKLITTITNEWLVKYNASFSMPETRHSVKVLSSAMEKMRELNMEAAEDRFYSFIKERFDALERITTIVKKMLDL